MRTVHVVAGLTAAGIFALTAGTGQAAAYRSNISNAGGTPSRMPAEPAETSQPHMHPAGAVEAQPVSPSTATRSEAEDRMAAESMDTGAAAGAAYAPSREGEGAPAAAPVRRRWSWRWSSWWPWRGRAVRQDVRGEGKYQGAKTNRWREMALHGDPARALRELIAAVDHHPIDRPPNSVLDRRNAAEALGLLGDSRAIGPLEDALNDPDFLVRYNAARSLAILRGAAP